MHVAAVDPDQTPEQPVRSFGTFTGDLQRLADWFTSCGVRTVAMESTGVYWIPVFEILDQRGFEVVLVNARDAKHVPGRKTDISDAQWLQRRVCQKFRVWGSIRTKGPPPCRAANRLPFRMPCWTSCSTGLIPAPPSIRTACSTR